MRELVEIKGVKGIRVRYGLTNADMGEILEITPQSYHMKEIGKRPFTDKEKVILVNTFHLTVDQFNEMFYHDALPWRKDHE